MENQVSIFENQIGIINLIEITKKSTDGLYTCDPAFRTGNANRINNCYAASSNGKLDSAINGILMDQICNDPNRYSKYQFCKDNYTQIPTASADISQWGNWDNCTTSCGGGTQNQKRSCNANNIGNKQAVRNPYLKPDKIGVTMKAPTVGAFTNKKNNIGYLSSPPIDSDYVIVRDDCLSQPLTQNQACNTQPCPTALETAFADHGGLIMLFLFIIFVCIVAYFVLKPKSKTGGLSVIVSILKSVGVLN